MGITFKHIYHKGGSFMEKGKHHKEKMEIGRGVETLFRVTFSNQIHLIQIADNKANSIITINTLVITLFMGLSGYGTISEKINLRSMNVIIPVILLMISCLLSIIFALIAAQPRIIKSKKNTQEVPLNNSLLFFGSIQDRNLDAYLADMDKLTHSPDSVYHALEIEIYYQSKVLNRKYRLLRIAFLVFSYGFVGSVIVFLVNFLFNY